MVNKKNIKKNVEKVVKQKVLSFEEKTKAVNELLNSLGLNVISEAIVTHKYKFIENIIVYLLKKLVNITTRIRLVEKK